MKKMFWMTIAVLCIFALTSCRRDGERQYIIDIPLHFNAGTIEFYAVEYFQRLVQEGSGGRISVRLFPGSALGSEMDNIEQVRSGLVQMSVFGDLFGAQLAGEYDLTVAPFLLRSYDDVVDVWEGQLGARMRTAIEERGNMVFLGIQKRGARKLTANRPITTLADLQGLRLRIPEIPLLVTIWGGMGVTTTPVALAEVYTALQTGVVDAQENPISLIHAFRFYEVNRYIMLTNHQQSKYHWIMNRDFFNSLSAEFQELITDSARRAIEWGDYRVDSNERELMEYMRNQGVTFVAVDNQMFIDAARPLVEQALAGWHPLVGVWLQNH